MFLKRGEGWVQAPGDRTETAFGVPLVDFLHQLQQKKNIKLGYEDP